VDLGKLASFLEGRANGDGPITYGELTRQLGLPPPDGAWEAHPLAAAFDALDREDAAADRPFRTSMVVAKETGLPGNGFFKSLFELKGRSAKSDDQRLDEWVKESRLAMEHKW